MNKCIRYAVLFFVFLMNHFTGACQMKMEYGNNKTAGKYFSVRGIKMYCEIYGKGQPLLVLHGNGGTINSFSKTIPYFSKAYKVIAVDSRAHGKSTDTGDSLSFEMMADDFATLLDTLKIDSAYVLGWSDGGISALLLAMRHPEKVKKLVTTGANLIPDSTALMPELYRQFQRGYNENKNKTFTEPALRNDWKVFLLDFFQPHIMPDELSVIKCPSLIIAGDHDVIVPEHTITIFRHIPNAQLWILPNSGHATLKEHADEFNKKVDTFFRQ